MFSIHGFTSKLIYVLGFSMAQIAENMKKMPQMIEDHRQQKREQRRQSAEKSLKDPTKLLAVLKKKGSSKSQQELEKLLKQHKQK
jgi:hypothetical protein